MEVEADFLHALRNRGLRDAVLQRNLGHGDALQLGIAEREVDAVDGQSAAVLGAEVGDDASAELQGIDLVFDYGDRWVHRLVGKRRGAIRSILMQHEADEDC